MKGYNVPQIKREKMLLYQFQFSKFIYDNTKEIKNEKKIAIREFLKTVKYLNFVTKVNKQSIKNLVINISNIYLKCIFLKKKDKQFILRFINLFYLLNYKIKYKYNFLNILR